jgi:hypothetical protein
LKGEAIWFSNSGMSYDTKNQKNGPEPLEKGAALSTVFFVEEKEEAPPAKEIQPPSKSNENDAD